ncbi:MULTISPECIES: Tn3 family transposase [unclassified Streptomyces]|uniref:Tn3 family transposase n=1 Tax=unclassified Streptomyces TaxID=2593676 RepID=UPI000DC28E14|nr:MULTISPECIES: Tn3 family transposase [unclassified Streptomyces]RAJ89198.1 Tn3 transposase DDE domain-containing protein [Streptomyces sp. PsTaAH-137]
MSGLGGCVAPYRERDAGGSEPQQGVVVEVPAPVNQLRADGFDVLGEDVARLSPFVRHHINVLGRYSFQLSDLPGGLRPLRDRHAADEM